MTESSRVLPMYGGCQRAYVCAPGFTCVCACVCRSEIDFGISFSITLHLGFLRQGLSLNLELTVLARLLGQRLPRILYLFLLQLWGFRCMPLRQAFYVSSRDLVLVLTSTLWSEPPQHPQKLVMSHCWELNSDPLLKSSKHS